MSFTITSCRVHPAFPDVGAVSTLRGFARITLNDELTLSGIHIVENKGGLHLLWPLGSKRENRTYQSIWHPKGNLKALITEAVLAQYHRVLNDMEVSP